MEPSQASTGDITSVYHVFTRNNNNTIHLAVEDKLQQI
jgi:hypothetical protein